MDLADVGGYFHTGALNLGEIVYICALNSPKGRTSCTCEITHLYPYPTVELVCKGSVFNGAYPSSY